MKNALIVAAGLTLAMPSFAEGPVDVAPRVKVVKATAVSSANVDSVTGSLFASKMLPIGFEVGGRLQYSKVQRGDEVKAGQVLGSLDTEIIDAQVAQAEAGLAAAEAGSTLATDVAGRTDRLKNEGSVSDLQMKQTDTQSKAAQAQVMAAKAALAQAKAGKRRHAVTAPFAGMLIDAPDQTGGMVGPGMPIYVVSQLDPLILKTTIAENMRASVKPGLKVRVMSVAGDARTDDAVVKAVIPSADPQTRRVPVEILVPNKDGKFVANTLARLYYPTTEKKPGYTIPATALGTQNGDHVFTVDAKGEVRKVAVAVIERGIREITVLSDVPLTDIVDYPTPALVDGSRVSQR